MQILREEHLLLLRILLSLGLLNIISIIMRMNMHSTLNLFLPTITTKIATLIKIIIIITTTISIHSLTTLLDHEFLTLDKQDLEVRVTRLFPLMMAIIRIKTMILR
jgi:hypothetical protein